MINPNSDKNKVDNADISIAKVYPNFVKKLELKPFRHIKDLELNFTNPITAISGTNRSGKSTILMALACSHLRFQKRDPKNGHLERQTWSSLMKFTIHDKQTEDWTYFMTVKTGGKVERKRGQRKKNTNKWNGIGKKESQFPNRQVIFSDLDRIVPARFFGTTIFRKTRYAKSKDISISKAHKIQEYISYILEENFNLKRITEHLDKDVFQYKAKNQYSSYNAASGEEVLTNLIIDIVESDYKSLILIDEIEVGLHPKVQRRLMDVIYHISIKESKQFIFSTHSPTILDCLSNSSRIFIEKDNANNSKGISNISVNAALSKMDSESYPLLDIYCEDDESKFILFKAISSIAKFKNLNSFSKLFNIIVSGSSDTTYKNFKAHQRTYKNKRITCGFACVLDGDMRAIKDNKGNLTYPAENGLHFLYSNEPPEKFLTRAFNEIYKNSVIEYHLNNSNPHCLLDKILENSAFSNKNEVMEECWQIFINSRNGKIYEKELHDFILDQAIKYSPEL